MRSLGSAGAAAVMVSCETGLTEAGPYGTRPRAGRKFAPWAGEEAPDTVAGSPYRP